MTEYALDCIFASLPKTTRGLPIVLSSSPQGDKFLYCNGNSVYIRDVDEITKVDIYTEHAVQTTVAKFSPSGFYVASGDQAGKVRIWDTTQSTHLLKAEYQPISGQVRDISWSDDSKRLAVVGEGRDRFGHVFLFDTGTSNGNLSGQSRAMSSIDFRPNKPYRLISGSEDNTVAIFEGPPFKFKTLFHEHARFVHCVRYNKDGSMFASAGADGKVVLFEGVEGGKISELIDNSIGGEEINAKKAHEGGVFGLAWSPDGRQLATASADKSIKLWDAEQRQLTGVVKFGSALEDQQLSVVWLSKVIVSASLAGFLSYIDPETKTISKVLKGHNKPITALALTTDKTFAFTADSEGHIARWEISTGTSERLTPAIHKSQVVGLTLSTNGTLTSIGWDDSLVLTADVIKNIEDLHPLSQELSSQPRGIASMPDLEKSIIACHKSILVFSKDKQITSFDIKYETNCAALHSSGKIVAIGCQDNKLRIFDLDLNGKLSEKKVLTHQGSVTSANFSPDGKYLVATDIARKVIPYEVDADFKIASEKDWSFHTARINCCAWSANNRYIATGGLDTNIIVWDLKNSGEHPLIIKGAHPMNQINCILWLSDNRLISVGQDSNVKLWTLQL